MDARLDTMRKDIGKMVERMGPREVAMVYSLSRAIDTRRVK